MSHLDLHLYEIPNNWLIMITTRIAQCSLWKWNGKVSIKSARKFKLRRIEFILCSPNSLPFVLRTIVDWCLFESVIVIKIDFRRNWGQECYLQNCSGASKYFKRIPGKGHFVRNLPRWESWPENESCDKIKKIQIVAQLVIRFFIHVVRKLRHKCLMHFFNEVICMFALSERIINKILPVYKYQTWFIYCGVQRNSVH